MIHMGTLFEPFFWVLNRVLSNKYPFPTVMAYIQHYNEKNEFDGIVLIDRAIPPLGWSMPGGFVEYNESAEEAIIRECKEETGLDIEKETQFHAYSFCKTNEKVHTIEIVFIAKAKGAFASSSDAKNIGLFLPGEWPSLALNQERILMDIAAFEKTGERPR